MKLSEGELMNLVNLLIQEYLDGKIPAEGAWGEILIQTGTLDEE